MSNQTAPVVVRPVSSILPVAALLLIAVSGGGCATMINGTTQSFHIQSSPPGATVLVDGQPAGVTPLPVKLKRSSNHEVEVRHDGFDSQRYRFVQNPTFWTWLNLVGGITLVGWVVDLATQADNQLCPVPVTWGTHVTVAGNSVHFDLRRSTPAVAVAPGPAAVSSREPAITR
jgi:hypothetical protein